MLYYYIGVVVCDVFNLVSAEYVIFSKLLYVHDIVVLVEQQNEKACRGASDIECTWKTRISSKWMTIDIFYCHYLYIYMKELLFFPLNDPCDREAQLAFCPSLLFFLSWFFCMLDLGVTAEQREMLSSDHTDFFFLPHFLYV